MHQTDHASLRRSVPLYPPLVLHFPQETTVQAIAYSPDGLQIVSGHESGAIRLWDLRRTPSATHETPSATHETPSAMPERRQVVAGGCHTLSKAECCKFVDGRSQWDGQACCPSKSPAFPSGNGCEPERWVDANAAPLKAVCEGAAAGPSESVVRMWPLRWAITMAISVVLLCVLLRFGRSLSSVSEVKCATE